MGVIPTRWVALAVLLLALLVGAGWGVRQYGNSRVAAQELSTVKEAVSEAVAEQKAAVKVDVAQAAQRRSLSDSVASPGIRKEKDEQDRLQSLDPAVRLGVLNDRVARANAAIASAGILPDEVR